MNHVLNVRISTIYAAYLNVNKFWSSVAVLVLYLHNKIEKFVICLCNKMSLSQRRLTLQSLKHFRKSNFLKIQNSQATARYGVWKNTSFDNRKSSIKIYLSCLRKRTNAYNSEDMRFSFCLSQLLILFLLLYGLLKVR